MTSRRRVSGLAEVAGAAVLLVLLARPLIFGGSDRGVDFYTHYWYVLHQGEALRDGGPSLWLHNDSGIFSSFYAFYGGTLYVLTGALALLLGSTKVAYVFSFLLAFAASYGGWWWLARQAGLRGLAAHAPGLVFVTTAYAMTLLYVRGDWPEHVAVAMLPLLAASGLSVLRADRLRPLPALALAGSVLVFAGSHNLSLLCGSVVLVLAGAALLLAVPEARRMVTRAGVLRVLAIVGPAVLVNAWFLIPDLVYGSSTNIVDLRWQWEKFLHDTRPNVDLKHLLALSRGGVAQVPREAFALPVLAMGWTLVVLALARPRLRDPWLRVLGALAAVGTIVLLAMTQVGVLRGPFVMVQFSYRLESYINLMVSGCVLAGLVLLKGASVPARARSGLSVAFALIAVVSVAGAVWQSDVHRDPASYVEWQDFRPYYTGEDLNQGIWDYAQAKEPYLEDPAELPYMAFDPEEAAAHGRVTATAPAPPGSPVVTNIAGLWRLLDLSGGRFVGLSTGGRAIVQLDAATVTVTAKRPPAFVIGRWLSFLGLAGLAANAVAFAIRARRRRRRRGPGDAETVEVPPVGEPTAV